MLRLPENWLGMHGGAAKCLLNQASDAGMRIQIARFLMWAALDLMAFSRIRTGEFHLEEVEPLTWRAGKLVYRYFPTIDDDTLRQCSILGKKIYEQFLIVPPNCQQILTQALEVTLRAEVPSVFSIDSFIRWRIMFASVDLGKTSAETAQTMVLGYNRHVSEKCSGTSLRIEVASAEKQTSISDSNDFRVRVPTYNAKLHSEEVERGEKPEFGDPEVPVLIRESAGIRIVLGSHDYEDMQKPDIQIERQPNGWAIFLHPAGGGDLSGCVYFHDDGRSFLQPECGLAPSEVIKMIEPFEPVPGFDS
jgi:hypothetical protein